MTRHTPARVLEVRWRLRGLETDHLRHVLALARRDGRPITCTEALLELRRRRAPAPPVPAPARRPRLRRNPGIGVHLDRAVGLLAAGELTRAELGARLGLGLTRTDQVLRRLLDDRRVRRADRDGDPRSWFALAPEER